MSSEDECNSSEEESGSDDDFGSEVQEEPAEQQKTTSKVRELWFAGKRTSVGGSSIKLSERLQAQDKERRLSAPNMGERNRRPSALSAVGPLARRASLGAQMQAEDILKNLESRVTRAHGEAPVEARRENEDETAKPGFEWIAKVQALEDVRERAKQFNDQMIFVFEAAGVDTSALCARDKIKLNENLRNEIENLLQSVTKSAFELVSTDYEELVILRRVVSEMDDKVADMNTTYLKEISMTRDRHRTPSEVVQEVSRKFDFEDRKEDSPHVEFYEPLKYLSEAVKGTVLQILDEKIKAMFSFDPTLRDRVNDFEIARFEDTMKDERLRSFERLNSRLRGENRDFREQVNKLEKKLEKMNWEVVQVQKESRRVESEIAELKARPETTVQTLDAETQYETPSQLGRALPLEAVFVPLISSDNGAKRRPSMQSSRADSMQRVPSIRNDQRCDAAVQAELHDSRESDGGDVDKQRRPVVHRKTSFGCLLEKEESEMLSSSAKADLEIELNRMRRDFDKAKQILLQRDKLVKRLQKELEEAQSKQAHYKANAEEVHPKPEKDAAEGREDGDSSKVCTQTWEIDEMNMQEDMKMQEKLLTAQEKMVEEKERADQAWQQVELLREQARALRNERDEARTEATKAEKRRMELAAACADGSASQELSADLSRASHEKTALTDEIDHLKGALSMALSRNAALEVLLASHGSNVQIAPKPAAHRTLETLKLESRAIECLQSKRGELREKVSIQKEQLAELVKDNTILHLALEEMQQEVRGLTEQLRKVVPAIEVMDADLEACLNRMDKVVKNGGGAYVRLHKDNKLREIAQHVRSNASSTRASTEIISDEEVMSRQHQEDDSRSNRTHPKAVPSKAVTMAKQEKVFSRDCIGSSPPMSPMSPRAHDTAGHAPLPPPVSYSARRSRGDEHIVGPAAALSSPMPTPRARDGPLPSLSTKKRSFTNPDVDIKSSPRLAPLGSSDVRGSLVLGNKGGMAVLGGLGKPVRSGRG